jgi:hypothetical protein
MNLLEAIEAGSQRVSGRCRFSYVRRIATPMSADTAFEACAMGAAYIGCHPDADLGELAQDWGPIRRWMTEVLSDGPTADVFVINDLEVSGRGWGELLQRLASERFSRIEVCYKAEDET